MKPTRVWIGISLIAVGVFGVLDATGTLDANKTIGEWWPLVVIGWGLADMFGDRRVSLGSTAIVAVGVALLADEQAWPIETLVWSLLFAAAGIAVLATSRRKQETNTEPSTTESEGSMGCCCY